MNEKNEMTMKETERRTYRMELVLRDGTREVAYEMTVSYDVWDKDKKVQPRKERIE